MKRIALLILISALALAAAACDGTAGAVVDSMTVPEIGNDEVAGEQIEESPAVTEGIEARSIASVSVEPVASPAPVFEQSVNGAVQTIETATPAPSDAQESFAYSDDNSVTVRYYDMEAEKEVETQYPVEDTSDPLAVVDGVTSALRDTLGDQNVKVNSTNYSNGNLFIDFDSSIYDLGLSSGDEHQLLDSIADTYLSNVDGIRAVYYTVDGEPYSSEHTQLMANEAYKTAG